MKSNLCIAFLVGWMMISVGSALAQPSVQLKGYVKELGAFQLSNDLSKVHFDNIVHHRIESRWDFGSGFSAQADARTRWISGYSVRNTPGYGSLIDFDPGVIDLSHNWVDTDRHVVNSSIDRLHLSWIKNQWEVHAGRQRINWGKTMVWNPNDLFNNFAWLDFDYEERPGTDAARVQYNWGYASSAEVAYKITDDIQNSVIAAMYRGNIGTYDIQTIAGYYEDQFAAGVGWAGYIGTSGFKGEMTLFMPDNTVSAVIGADHMLSNGVMLSGELLYNGGYDDEVNSETSLLRPPSASNLFIASTGYFANASASPHPLVNVSFGVLGSMTRSVHIFIPQISYSASENIDVLLLAQLLKGSALENATETPNAVFIRLKWSY